MAQHTQLSSEIAVTYPPCCWGKPSSVIFAVLQTDLHTAYCTFCVLFPSQLGGGLIKTPRGVLSFHLHLLSVSLGALTTEKSPYVRSPLTFPRQKIATPFTMSATRLAFIHEPSKQRGEDGLAFGILYFNSTMIGIYANVR